MKARSFQYIAELPSGYEYKLFQIAGEIRILGINPDKKPIAFTLHNTKELLEIDLEEEIDFNLKE
jgi:hypothetical protein